MNTQIKEFALQAGLIGSLSSDHEGLANFDYRKFAELIVRECANIALREDYDAYDCILNHFGVE